MTHPTDYSPFKQKSGNEKLSFTLKNDEHIKIGGIEEEDGSIDLVNSKN